MSRMIMSKMDDVEGYTTTSSRLVLAVGLAAATIILFLAVIAVGGALQARLAPWPGIGLIILAIAAFTLSWKRESFVVAGLLAISGVVGLTYGLVITQFLEVIEFPGPIFGIIIGILLLGLGVGKGIQTARIRRQRLTLDG